MFCSSCGASLQAALTYCNRCGARTALSTNPLGVTRPQEDKLVEVVHMTGIVSGAVSVAGFIFVYVIMDKLLDKAIKPSAIVVFVMFSLATVFGISSLLIRQFSRVLNTYLGTPEKADEGDHEEPAVPKLESRREPLMSVTENTTRAFEPVLRDQDS